MAFPNGAKPCKVGTTVAIRHEFMSAKRRCLIYNLFLKMIGEGFSMLVRHQQQSSRKASDLPHMISHEFSGISGGKAWKEQHRSSAHLSSCLRLTWPWLVRPWMNWWPTPRRQRQWAKMKEGPDLGCQGLEINLVWEWLTSHWDGLWVGHSKFMIFSGFKLPSFNHILIDLGYEPAWEKSAFLWLSLRFGMFWV
jgi:hypothetical protein